MKMYMTPCFPMYRQGMSKHRQTKVLTVNLRVCLSFIQQSKWYKEKNNTWLIRHQNSFRISVTDLDQVSWDELAINLYGSSFYVGWIRGILYLFYLWPQHALAMLGKHISSRAYNVRAIEPHSPHGDFDALALHFV